MTTRNRTAVTTEAAAQAALRRGATPQLAGEEERVARMRLGAPLPRTARLERKAPAGSDLELELLAFEIEALHRWKAHLQKIRAQRAPTPAPAPVTAPSRTKEKIVRALRKKS